MADGGFELGEMRRVIPGPDTQRQFRTALGQFTTGVTVVTTMTPQGPLGMTVNSFSSISMDPALVMWCPAKSSGRYAPFVAAEHFAIHVLGTAEAHIANAFVRNGQAFDGLALSTGEAGVPLIDTCLARFECRRFQVHDAGDHSIILGLVTAAGYRDGEALAFCNGRFGRIDTDA